MRRRPEADGAWQARHGGEGMIRQDLAHPVRDGRHVRDKIKDLQELAALLPALRSEGKTVVHCHGVFDPLHIGHIRHFQQAKKLGHILVVTVTPDRFVNKGPHRPIFPQELRAETIASLECVDYVAVNQSPMAIETIQALKPDVYAKGSEFSAGRDTTGAIGLEAAAVSAVGGRVAFTDDITFSASNLVNRHFPVFSKEVSDYLAGFAARYGPSGVIPCLEGIAALKVLVVGEAIIDEYQYCEAIGKSSKEPTLAVKSLTAEKFAGGTLAVANHVANFTDSVTLLTLLGEGDMNESFIRDRLHSKIEKRFLYRKDAPTIVKRRFIEKYFFHKLFEVYEINDTAPDEVDGRRLCDALRGQLGGYDLVIVFDFGHGMICPEAVRMLCDEAPFLAVNTQSNAGNLGYHTISKYPRADYICVAENEMRLDARDRRGDLRGMVENVARRQQCDRVIVTRGSRGCLCYSEDEGFCEVPAFAGQVVDRVGAGDAFLSITAPCVAQDAPIEVVGFIGNVVGAQAVATVGHRTSVERVPLIRHIEHLLK
jgi:rfaE bifunctional protein nucleotidyltransferase chain/domain